MKHYLIVYDRSDREIVYLDRYTDGREAIAKRFEIEAAAKTDWEVVVLSADSLAAVRRTHGRYFLTAAELVMRLTP